MGSGIRCARCGKEVPPKHVRMYDEECGTFKCFCDTSEWQAWKRDRAAQKRECEDVSR